MTEQGIQTKWEPLGGNLCVCTSPRHRFGTDTILLSDFSRPKPKEQRAVELCAGCGALSLLWFRENKSDLTVDAVEIQEDACALLTRSAEKNGLLGRYRPVHADLRIGKDFLPHGCYDLVACNPPYKPMGTGVVSTQASDLVARHESQCTVEDVARAAAALLRFSGRLCLCQRPERLADVMGAVRHNGMEPKRLRFVQQRPGKAPKLFLLEARRGGRPGGLVVEPVLLLEAEPGGYSEEMRRIYGDYRQKEGRT